jgi:hypothetical protein
MNLSKIPTMYSEKQRLEGLAIIVLSSLYKKVAYDAIRITHNVYDDKQHSYQLVFLNYTIVVSQDSNKQNYFAAWNNQKVSCNLNTKMNQPYLLNSPEAVLSKLSQFYREAKINA